MRIGPLRMTGCSPDRKWRQSRSRNRAYVLGMRNQKLRNIRPFHRKLRNHDPRFFYSRSSTSTMATEGGAHFSPEVRVSRALFLVQGDVLYDVRVLCLAWLPELALASYPFPAILFSYTIIYRITGNFCGNLISAVFCG